MRTVFYTALISAASAASKTILWDYKTNNGADWTDLCATGKSQSPIDLSDINATAYGAPGNNGYMYQNYSTNWRAVSQVVQTDVTATYGNDKQLNSAFKVSRDDATKAAPAILELTDGSAWTLQSYAPAQFHVHTPSEHTVNGKYMDLELHFVNLAHGEYAQSTAGKGALAAFGIFFTAVDCTKDRTTADAVKLCERELHKTDDIFEYMKIDAMTAAFEAGTLKAEVKTKTVVDFARILSLVDTNKFWRYSGSVTTPPCQEPVTWTVIQDPLFIRQEYYNAIKAQYDAYGTPAMTAAGLKNGNARMIMPLNDRTLMKVTNTNGAIALMTAATAAMSSFLLF